MRSRAKRALRSIPHVFGLELVRYYEPSFLPAKRIEILRDQMISVVLDVGANSGQYAEMLRSDGYRGRIVSFEPTSEAFAELVQRARADQTWTCEQRALRDADGESTINLSANSWSSSFLPLAPQHVKSAPESRYIGREAVTTSRLDSLLPRLLRIGDRIFLKLDVQGGELSVLHGGIEALCHVHAVECEVSVVALYDGQPLIGEVLEYLSKRGFALAGLQPSFLDPRTGQVLQLDALFVRSR
jgi:FkbM family methyltransferase